jgi:glutamate/aspartate transport system substrate-binding protein
VSFISNDAACAAFATEVCMKAKDCIAIALVLFSVGAQAQPTTLSGTLKKIKETGQVTLGVRESSIPFSYQDDKQVYRGYSIDLCARIVASIKAKLGMEKLEVKQVPITSATRIPLMVNQTIDLTCGSDANTVDRQRQVAFSWTTFIGNEAVVSKKSSNIRTVDDLKGKTVVSTSGSTDVKLVNDLNKERNLDLKVLVGADHGASFMMMDTGRASAFVMTDILIASLVANSKNSDQFQTFIVDVMPVEPWALMMRRDDPEFRGVVNETLAGLFRSGEIKALYSKWFESDLPYLAMNLRIPMSPKLRQAFAVPNDSGDPKDYK